MNQRAKNNAFDAKTLKKQIAAELRAELRSELRAEMREEMRAEREIRYDLQAEVAKLRKGKKTRPDTRLPKSRAGGQGPCGWAGAVF